ncbi:MAG: response regulator [bacterium]
MSKILIVDDDNMVRGMLKMTLEEVGYEVEVACDGCDALRILDGGEFRLMVTDIVMPEKEGLELIREVRRDHPDVKIIAISGGGRNGPQFYLEAAGKFGADFTFYKPVESEQLLSAVQSLMTEDSPATF